MKKYIACITMAIALLGAGACKKDKEEVFPRFPPPSWEKQASGKYPYSMTAVVKLPSQLQSGYHENDELAAFIGEECRGVAEPVEVGGARLFYLLIQGAAAESERVVFKYYSTGNSYIYIADNTLEFNTDGNYGTADQPMALVLRPRK